MLINELMEKVIKTLDYYRGKTLLQLRLFRFRLWQVKLVKPIFVVGCSRAGTTLVYKTMSESENLGSLQKETHDFWAKMHPIEDRDWLSHAIPEHFACDQDRKVVSRFFYSRTGNERIVDKNNQNGLSIPYLFKLFPDAHFIYIKRNPGDNINSLIHGWNKADEFATWSDDLPKKINIEQGKNERWCFFLAKGWQQYIKANIEDVCAFQYIAMNEAILNAKQDIPAKQWHEISYETLINAPAQEFEEIYHGCELPFGEHLKKHCNEVLQKPYNTFSEIRVDKWKDGQNKEKISKVLTDVHAIATRMGY